MMFEDYTKQILDKIKDNRKTIFIQNEHKNRQLILELLNLLVVSDDLCVQQQNRQTIIVVFPMQIFYEWKKIILSLETSCVCSVIASYEDTYNNYYLNRNKNSSKIYFIEEYFFKLMISKSLIEKNSIVFVDPEIKHNEDGSEFNNNDNENSVVLAESIKFIYFVKNADSSKDKIFQINLETPIPNVHHLKISVPESEILTTARKIGIKLKNEVILNFERGIFKTNEHTLKTINTILDEELQEEKQLILEMYNTELKPLFIREIETNARIGITVYQQKSIKKYKTLYTKYLKRVNACLTRQEQINKFKEIIFEKELCTTPISKIASIVFSLTQQNTKSKIAILSTEIKLNQSLIDQCSCVCDNDSINIQNFVNVLSGSKNDNDTINQSIESNHSVLIGNSESVFLPHDLSDYTALIILDTNLTEKTKLLKCFSQSNSNDVLLVFEIES